MHDTRRMPRSPTPSAPGPMNTEARLRLEVGRLRASHQRRLFGQRLQVGTLAGARHDVGIPYPPPAQLEQGLRFDLALGLAEESLADTAGKLPVPCEWWLTRPGIPECGDGDLRWFAAVRQAGQALAGEDPALLPTTLWVVTRTGWLDVATGRSRTWKRLRL